MTGALVVTWGTETQVFGKSFTAGRIGTVTGRAVLPDLVLDDEYASPLHARFVPTGQGWTVEDLGSTNGTHVGTGVEREQVWEPRLLRKGDRVKIGHTILTVVPAG